MSIISQTTWDKFTQEEKEEILKDYRDLLSDNGYWSDEFTPEERSGVIQQMEWLFGKENLLPKALKYEDVARELFGTGMDTKCHFATVPCMGLKWDNKLQAIGRLLVVAQFLNGDWKPDWKNMTPDDKVWSLGIDENKIRTYYVQKYDGARAEIVYFRTEELAKQAIQILGEDTVRLALTTDF